LEFPFVDLLNDGTAFRWTPTMFLTAGNEMAINGAREYGMKVYPSSFEPDCNAYERSDGIPDSTFSRAASIGDGAEALIDAVFRSSISEVLGVGDFPAQFFVKTSNQPSFADGKHCSKFTRFYNTTLSTGANAAVPIVATVRARLDTFDKEMEWTNAIGLQVDTPFIEDHLVECASLGGHDGPGYQTVELVAASASRESVNSSFLPSFNLQAVLENYVMAPIRRAVLR
jgi:hypothetical protein